MKHDIGLIGLAVMGQNLVLNMANNGFSVAVYNRTTSVTDEFVNDLPDRPEDVVHPGTADRIDGYHTVEEFVKNLKTPRRVMIMVKAGGPVDAVIEQLKPLLDKGDIIIDGGNSEYADTNRRTEDLRESGFRFIGTGVSGGEEGALKGPSIMPGGDKEGWPFVKDIFQKISAKVGPNNDIPCCEWVGEAGAGHYVKMVHNGIEYGDMQLICEAYYILKHTLGLSNEELYQVFKEWNEGKLESYLIEITRDIFTVKDPETGNYLVDDILDTAKQKGTGKWMSQHALDLGVPTTLITEAVYARCLSGQKDARVRASKVLEGPEVKFDGDKKQFIDDVREALYASKLVSYAQGYVQLDAAAKEFGWKLNNGDIALLWRGGCIIRSRFLQDIKAAFDKNPDLENLLLDDFFKKAIDEAQPSWRRVVASAVNNGLPVPGFSAALTYYDGYRQDRLPANLLQAQRDYFGAHTYERVDKERGETFHTDWIRERKLT
ncbi:decarboxylating NADP(+)-dependent phosphogluconate dehydrogenase [Rubinisphaera sp.]|uniref:decarboxylating NADP(+)-dependent phosphogluconate dehydrogenase n=1 Tax=Rubinisphaera sp. TaxID=2024857 RepID=UPI000C0D3891|nr:decarboxylating NADP(+)-dependent phosphogluconate dehydrogenase [Rubinisphaera sp.]MBV12373.1 phosphogluconate dehydrogenase (NADP(+)-dependent, decarboxylating) [Rubinisphaera sp.]HCS50545.1 phosphogluconate dehydrogenase (NADP(+)-dependent, decarboxylating) [Planctomycetaceae bacterium]|tara:strand:+ start:4550 stop:6016 length:1467 start_codon:yes stop_codon:yes gene_type:complete